MNAIPEEVRMIRVRQIEDWLDKGLITWEELLSIYGAANEQDHSHLSDQGTENSEELCA